jgi:hypothetical protein
MTYTQIQKVEEQLKSWAQAPSPTEMKKIQHTHEMIKSALNKYLPDEIRKSHGLNLELPEIYLQGSYANSTNIRYDSDVDIVVQLNSIFWYDISQLSGLEQLSYPIPPPPPLTYNYLDFKNDVFKALQITFGNSVKYKDKCIVVENNSTRATADVVPCFLLKNYKKYRSMFDQYSIEGIKFINTANWSEVVNYPKLHIRNCELKNTITDGSYKSLVRVFKNINSVLVEAKVLNDKTASSYYIENLLYNCSQGCFNGTFVNCMLEIFQFLFDSLNSGRISGFICANEQDSLFSNKTWNHIDAQVYILKTAEYFMSMIKRVQQ